MKECKNRKDSGQYEQRARREVNPIVVARPNNSAATTKICHSGEVTKYFERENTYTNTHTKTNTKNPIVVARPNNSAATAESVTPEKSPTILREKIQIQTHIQIQTQAGKSNCVGATK